MLIIKEAIKKLANKENLSYQMAEQSMNEIMENLASDIQKSAYLVALALKGESIEEITASAKALRNHCQKVLENQNVLEIVGTGGDGSNSFNISTTSAILLSTAGVKVAKHGNRASSSKCGSADVLEELGVNINISPQKAKEMLDKINICFLFAQNYHIAMRFVAPIRKELGIRTIFNILGPLISPAGADIELMGVYDKSLVEPLARVLYNLGVKRAMVVYGHNKMDEISLCDKTTICELDARLEENNGRFKLYEIAPEDFNLSRCASGDLIGGDPKSNANITKQILQGRKDGIWKARSEAVALNSGAALYLYGKCDNIKSGVELAINMLDSGICAKRLEQFIAMSNE